MAIDTEFEDSLRKSAEPPCPRCEVPLVKVEQPSGMSVSAFAYRRAGDYVCENCRTLQRDGRLSTRAKTAWYRGELDGTIKPRKERHAVGSVRQV